MLVTRALCIRSRVTLNIVSRDAHNIHVSPINIKTLADATLENIAMPRLA